MIKIEAITLEEAYSQASFKLKCSVTELQTEVVQHPNKGVLGLFKKTAIIVATKREKEVLEKKRPKVQERKIVKEVVKEKVEDIKPDPIKEKVEIVNRVENIINRVKSIKKESSKVLKKVEESKKSSKKNRLFTVINDTIMPASFVSTQDEEQEQDSNSTDVAKTIKDEINALFKLACFEIDEIQVGIYDDNTLFVEFNGKDSALLIGKEGYRYKALSYMLFNWINTKYKLQLRLEIAEFLQNQEESVSKYLMGVKESIDKDGRVQTKILDGVLVQIALNELRDTYPDKYIAIRSTRDGLKYIIVNDYHSK